VKILSIPGAIGVGAFAFVIVCAALYFGGVWLLHWVARERETDNG